VARYVSHWSFGVSDGGPGHCFPSGHATAGFAFVSLYFLFRRWRPPAAPWVLLAVCGIGLLFGWAQMVRGAHYPSHTLWSAWLCWTFCAIVDAVSRRGELYQPAKVG
jgi:membrane-associated PAP2 superfamily phosphatase